MAKYLQLLVIVTIFIVAPHLNAQSMKDVQIEQNRTDPNKQIESNIRRSSSIMRRNENQIERRRTFYPDRFRTGALKKKLKVNAEDSVKYESFLKNPNTGIFRLLTPADCLKKDKKPNSQCLINNVEIKEFANSYSFGKRQHTDSARGDISLTNNNLEARTSDIQTIIVALGDESLESLTLESKGVAYLRKFNPLSQIRQVRKQYDDFLKGIVFENFEYLKSAPVKLDDAYVVRSIAYADSYDTAGKEYFDTIVAFKIVRLEQDGSATLLWKELSRKHSPVLLRDKK